MHAPHVRPVASNVAGSLLVQPEENTEHGNDAQASMTAQARLVDVDGAAVWKWPLGQLVHGLHAAAPPVLYEPIGHDAHELAPSTGAYVPAGQLAHVNGFLSWPLNAV